MLKELPKEMEEEVRKMKTWQIWLIILWEEMELPSHDIHKFVTCLYFHLSLSLP